MRGPIPNCKIQNVSDELSGRRMEHHSQGWHVCESNFANALMCCDEDLQEDTYRDVVAVHDSEVLGVGIEPTLRTEGVWVRTKHSSVPMCYPGIYPNDGLNHIDAISASGQRR